MAAVAAMGFETDAMRQRVCAAAGVLFSKSENHPKL